MASYNYLTTPTTCPSIMSHFLPIQTDFPPNKLDSESRSDALQNHDNPQSWAKEEQELVKALLEELEKKFDEAAKKWSSYQLYLFDKVPPTA